jgi:hypoxanthine-guanine phosphoribosyltransferase
VSGIDLKTIAGRDVIIIEDIIDTGAWVAGRQLAPRRC